MTSQRFACVTRSLTSLLATQARVRAGVTLCRLTITPPRLSRLRCAARLLPSPPVSCPLAALFLPPPLLLLLPHAHPRSPPECPLHVRLCFAVPARAGAAAQDSRPRPRCRRGHPRPSHAGLTSRPAAPPRQQPPALRCAHTLPAALCSHLPLSSPALFRRAHDAQRRRRQLPVALRAR